MSWQQSFASKAVVNSAEHPHIIWLQAIEDTHCHAVLPRVGIFSKVGLVVPNVASGDRRMVASTQKRHWKHRVADTASVLQLTEFITALWHRHAYTGNQTRIAAQAYTCAQKAHATTNAVLGKCHNPRPGLWQS
jgi:hypothetical protein